ncbi:hypothetical protein F7725_020187, partial [Dissostichus mawsoni]
MHLQRNTEGKQTQTHTGEGVGAADVAVGLQAGEEDVEEPQAQEQQAGGDAGPPWPPELPPIEGRRLNRSTPMQMKAKMTAATVHATPIPRNTLTALLPVTLPTDASACWSCMAATLLAKVPSATNTTAVTVSRSPTVQPKCDARSPMKAVRRPMVLMENKKQAQPFQYSVGGTQANKTFQKT